MTHTIFAHILSLMTMLVAPAAADEPGVHEGRHAKRADLCEKLACTDDQRTKIDAIRTAGREASADERAEMKRLHQALKTERSKPSPNADEVARLQASLDAVKASLRTQRDASKTEISAVLTPEQRERFAAMKAKHDGKRGGKGKGKAHDGKRGGKGKGKAHAGKRGADGKAHASKRGPGGKAHASKRGPGGKGKAFAKRARSGRGAALAG